MADERDPSDERKPESYRAARIGVAAGLGLVVGVLLVMDAFSPEYSLSDVTLTLLLTTIATLLSVEAASILGKRR